MAIDHYVVIDATVDGNEARFINHSCDPNCDAAVEDGRIWIETVRDVAPDEELAYDYAYGLEEPHTPAVKRHYPCHCGSAGCRRTILAKKWLDCLIPQKYLIATSPSDPPSAGPKPGCLFTVLSVTLVPRSSA